MQRKSVRDDFYEQERYANQELRRFRANYPENAALIQNYVEDAEEILCVDFKPDKKGQRDDGSGSRICEKVSESSKGNFR